MLSRLYSTAGVASILSSPALLRMRPLMLMHVSYTAFLPLLHSNLAQAFARQEMMASEPSMNSGSDVF